MSFCTGFGSWNFAKKNNAMKINKEWHEKNQMPKNATFEQRLQWHLEHLKHCACRRELPKKLAEEMKKRGIAIPENLTT